MPRDVYTADMGQPPSPDEGAPPKRRVLKKPVVRRTVDEVYTADMGQPPSPDEGPTAPMPRPMPRPTSGTSAYAKGGKVGSASKRADGIASKGKTKGRVI